ncbi:MAG: multiple sugar transport system permease protein [Actinomycetota bacterium]|jgi:multiple sugar transport system permease protein|nr:multiple sugar transport system permease protein [Actinomycetota bacterium]
MSETIAATTAARNAKAPRRRRNETKRKQTIAAYAFVIPFLLLFLLMLVVPLVYSGYLSLFRSQLIGGLTFVGLGNFIQAATDPLFLAGVLRMAFFLVVQVPIMLALSLLFALLLDSGRLRFPRLIRLGIFIPYAVPGVVAALMWGYLYGDFGPFSQLAHFLTIPAPNFLGAGTALYSIMNIVTWGWVGYNMIVIYSALRSIPTELYDAAEMDGAGAIRVAWSIKIPAVRPAIILTAIFSVIGTFQLFNEPKLLQSVAPNVIDGAYTPNLYAYTLAFTDHEVNYAAAVSFILGIVIMIVSYVVQLSTQRRERAK